MRGRVLTFAVAAALALLATGCPLLDNNNGSDASCEGGPTLGSQCLSVYTYFCNNVAPACGISLPSDCASTAAMAHCPCGVENCDASSCETAALVSSCEAALQSLDCNAVVNAFMGGWPSECQAFLGQATPE
ncbi:MAG TPA: hypothetical protein VF765_33695 [Polyangiaceae bacterium]